MGDYIDNKVQDCRYYNRTPSKGLACVLGVTLAVTGINCGGGGGGSTPPPTNPPLTDVVRDQDEAFAQVIAYFNGIHEMSIDFTDMITTWLPDSTTPVPNVYEIKNLIPIRFDELDNPLIDTYLLVGPVDAADPTEMQKKLDAIYWNQSQAGAPKIFYIDPVTWAGDQQDNNEYFDNLEIALINFQSTTNPNTIIIHEIGKHRNP